MNEILKNKNFFLVFFTLLSGFFTCFSANAVQNEYVIEHDFFQNDFENGLLQEGFGAKKNFPNADILESSRMQAMTQIKNNYQLVLGLVKQKKFEQANEKLALLIEKNPNQSIYFYLKGLLQLINKDSVAAGQSFHKAIELNIENVPAYIGLAKLALDDKQFTEARMYANKGLKRDQYAVSAYMVLADVVMQQQDIEATEKLLLNARGKVKDNLKAELEILKLLGKVYGSKKQPEKMLSLATDLVKRNKGNLSALSFLSDAQITNQDLSGAEQTLRTIIAQQPKDARHLFLLARLLGVKKGKEIEALKLLDKAAINLDNPSLILSYKTALLVKQKQFQQAFSVAKQVDDSSPELSIGKILKGDVYLAEKKYDKALQSYQLAYQITPTTKVLDVMLLILTEQNKQVDAIALLENELAKNKDNTQIQFRLAVAYQNSGRYESSIKYYKKLIDKQQGNAIVLNNLAWVYSQLKHPKALKLAKEAFIKAPKSGAVADTYGYILLTNGRSKESLKILKQAAELSPELTEIQLHLAEAHIANQQKSQAKQILQQILTKEGAEKASAMKLMKEL